MIPPSSASHIPGILVFQCTTLATVSVTVRKLLSLIGLQHPPRWKYVLAVSYWKNVGELHTVKRRFCSYEEGK